MNRSRFLRVMLWFNILVVVVVGIQNMLSGASALFGVESVDASVDSELRFMTAFWLGYGYFIFWISRNLPERHEFVPALMGFLTLGATGRILSWVMVGQPDEFYIVAIAVEYVVAILTYAGYRQYQNHLLTD